MRLRAPTWLNGSVRGARTQNPKVRTSERLACGFLYPALRPRRYVHVLQNMPGRYLSLAPKTGYVDVTLRPLSNAFSSNTKKSRCLYNFFCNRASRPRPIVYFWKLRCLLTSKRDSVTSTTQLFVLTAFIRFDLKTRQYVCTIRSHSK